LSLEDALAEAFMEAQAPAHAASGAAAVGASSVAASEPSSAYTSTRSAHEGSDTTLAAAARSYFGPPLEPALLPLLQAPLRWLASAGGIVGISAVTASSVFGGEAGSDITSPLLRPGDPSTGASGGTQMQLVDGDAGTAEGQAQ
jgi:hypothetical protein